MMWLVMCVEKFDMEGINFPLPVKVVTDMIGYCPVYDDYDKAREDYPEQEIREIQFKEKED